jgi:photosystem II stability/assembly factor-like uncharacterized protein
MRSHKAICFVTLGIILSFSKGSDARWERTGGSGLTHATITCFAVSGTNLFAGTLREGVFLSTDNGTSWKAVNSGLPRGVIIKDLAVSGTDLFVGATQGIFRSPDGGQNWHKASAGLTGSGVLCLVVSGTNLFAGTYAGVFLSANNGKTWKAASSGLPKYFNYPYSINGLAVRGTNLFASTGDPLESQTAGVYVSPDNGKSWTRPTPGLSWGPIIMALIVSGPDLFIGTDQGILRSTDDGKNWTEANSGLPVKRDRMQISHLDVYALGSTGANLFAGTENGVFMSTDEGKSWTAVNSGLPGDTSVLCFAVSAECLFAGTSEAGVWRLPLLDLSIGKR